MTDDQLQEAINRAREFMNLTSTQGGLLYKSREHTAKALIELEAIQVNRASMATQPTLMRME